MLTVLQQKILQFSRRFLGTDQIPEQQSVLLSLGNGLKSLLTDPEKVRMSTTYKRCAEIVSLVSPMDISGGKYIRVGGEYDGGYVMLDDFQGERPEAAYSLGLGEDVSWDESIANRGIDVFMYDPAIDRLPKRHPKFHFFKLGVTGSGKGPCLKTLDELIAGNGHTACRRLIMKMDVEGCEWDIFREASQNVIGQFSQIVAELHDLPSIVYDSRYPSVIEVLRKINRTHQCVHVHANNCSSAVLWIGDLALPAGLEVTYVRRDNVKDGFAANTRQFPTELDRPNTAGLPDIYLGSFSCGRELSN